MYYGSSFPISREGNGRRTHMSISYTVRTVATLQVGDAVLAYVSADGHGRNFKSLLTAGLVSANLPTVGKITSVQVDDPAGDLSYAGDGAGDLAEQTTGGDAAVTPSQGPIHVNLVNAATDLVNAPSHMAPWFDPTVVIVVATGTGA
jgi:hypothetical protein